MGVYAWIRENVKHAVLLGFNDAVEQIGPPAQGGPMNEHLAAVLRQPQPLAMGGERASPMAVLSAPVSARPKRKRLGRTLGEIQPPPPKSA